LFDPSGLNPGFWERSRLNFLRAKWGTVIFFSKFLIFFGLCHGNFSGENQKMKELIREIYFMGGFFLQEYEALVELVKALSMLIS
jgi:hypothetical protein